MSEQEKQRSKEYSRVRDTFDKLSLDEQASFLVEAVFSTVTRGIERASETMTEELNTLFEQAQGGAEKGKGKARSEEGAPSKDGPKSKKSKGSAAGKAKTGKRKASSRKKAARKTKKTSSS